MYTLYRHYQQLYRGYQS